MSRGLSVRALCWRVRSGRHSGPKRAHPHSQKPCPNTSDRLLQGSPAPPTCASLQCARIQNYSRPSRRPVRRRVPAVVLDFDQRPHRGSRGRAGHSLVHRVRSQSRAQETLRDRSADRSRPLRSRYQLSHSPLRRALVGSLHRQPRHNKAQPKPAPSTASPVHQPRQIITIRNLGRKLDYRRGRDDEGTGKRRTNGKDCRQVEANDQDDACSDQCVPWVVT